MDDEDIVFDRDISAPKKKLKDRKRRKFKSSSDQSNDNLNKALNNSKNAENKNINNTNIDKNTNPNENLKIKFGKIKLNKPSNSALNINSLNHDKKKNYKDDINSNILNSDSHSFQGDNPNLNSSLDDKSRYQLLDRLGTNNNYNLNNQNNYYDKSVLLSMENDSKNNHNYDSLPKSNDNSLNKKINNFGKELKSKNNPIFNRKEFLREYDEVMKSGDKDKIIIILQKKIEYLVFNINDLNLIIQHLCNDIHKKEDVLHLLTDTNVRLKKSLNAFSNKLDSTISNEEKKITNSKSKLLYRKNYNSEGNNVEEIKLSKIDNVLAMNKILQKDNENLKNLLNSYGSIDKMKELENMNKLLKEQNNNLNEDILKLKKELLYHTYCEKKRSSFLEQIKYLTEENKRFKNDLKNLTKENNLYLEQIKSLKKDINKFSPGTNEDSPKNNILNNISILKSSKLPNINKSKKTLETENNKNLNNKDDKIEDIEFLLDKDEISILINLYQGDEKRYEEFKKKLIIYSKSKECIINKYRLEEKVLNKKIYSMTEQVEYLNHKVKESEIRIKIFQQKLNDSNFQNRILKKKYNEEKKEKENAQLKLKDFKKKNEKPIKNTSKNNKNKKKNNKDEKEIEDEEENENEYNLCSSLK